MLTGLPEWLGQFVSGVETISAGEGAAPQAATSGPGLLSPAHLWELANVYLLHSPLNLLLLTVVAVGVAAFPRPVLRDPLAVALLLTLGAYLAELAVFNPLLGSLCDWDIFAPVGILLPLAAWRVWQAIAPRRFPSAALARAVALLLPLGLAHLALLTMFFHQREPLLRRLTAYSRSERAVSSAGRQMLGSRLALYCVGEDYFPEYLLEFFDRDSTARRFLIYRLSELNDGRKLVELERRWREQFSSLDLGNIGAAMLDQDRRDDAIYYLRRSWLKEPGLLVANFNLAIYYKRIDRPAACLFHARMLAPDWQEKLIRQGQTSRELLELAESWDDKTKLELRQTALGHVVNNGRQLLQRGRFDSGEQELLAAWTMGYDSLAVMLWLGEGALRQKNWERSEHYFSRLLRATPGDWRVSCGLGLSLAGLGRREEALELAERLEQAGQYPSCIGSIRELAGTGPRAAGN